MTGVVFLFPGIPFGVGTITVVIVVAAARRDVPLLVVVDRRLAIPVVGFATVDSMLLTEAQSHLVQGPGLHGDHFGQV